MSFDRVIIIVMAVFSMIGAVDRICGNRLKLGASFGRGIVTMGPQREFFVVLQQYLSE